jgi:hypothetical protein
MVFISNTRASMRDKLQSLANALRRFELHNVYMRPALRSFLEDSVDLEE